MLELLPVIACVSWRLAADLPLRLAPHRSADARLGLFAAAGLASDQRCYFTSPSIEDHIAHHAKIFSRALCCSA
jgi:hypothetical protein